VALDQKELEACYRRLEKPLFNVLYRWLWSSADAMDVIQDSFMKLWRRRSSVKPDSVDALVWRIALNLARNRLASRNRWGWLPLPESLKSGSEPASQARLDERDAQLKGALEKLPPAQRDVLLLGVFGGLDRRNLAGVLGIPEGTVASRHHKAVRTLKELLAHD